MGARGVRGGRSVGGGEVADKERGRNGCRRHRAKVADDELQLLHALARPHVLIEPAAARGEYFVVYTTLYFRRRRRRVDNTMRRSPLR